FPLTPQRMKNGPCGLAQLPWFVRAPYAPYCMEGRNHPRREEHAQTARELAVIDLASLEESILKLPRQGRPGIGLDVARHHDIPAAADGDVQRRTRPARIGQARHEPGLFDETLGVVDARHGARHVAPPRQIAMALDGLCELVPRPHQRLE